MEFALYIGLAILAVIICWFVYSLFKGKPWSINLFYMRVFMQLLFDNPEFLTMLGFLDKFGIHGHNAKFADSSDAHEVKILERTKRDLAILRSYDRRKQNEVQLISTDILDWFVDDMLKNGEFRHHDYPVNQMFGVQSNVPDLMMNMHPLKTRTNAKDYIKRLQAVEKKFDQALEGLKIREAKDIVPPNFTIKHVINEMQEFIRQPARENPLYTVFNEKLAEAGMDSNTINNLAARVEAEIKLTVYPAYQKLIDYFVELEPKHQANHGVWALPDGEAYYTQCLRSHTTTDLSPAEVHEIGLQEVERLESRMAEILRAQGHASEYPTITLLELGKKEEFLYPNTDEGRDACIADYKQMLEVIDKAIKPVFDIGPKAGVDVQRVPEFKEKTSPGAYYQPSDLEGTRPGVFYANLRDMKEVQKFGMKTLAYHESIPGHHYQIATAMTLEGVPFFRRMIPFTAYAEGWAMYSETLAKELGMYDDDPYGELGYLDSILFRAVRLVVDTGIHYKRWTREQAIEYMAAHTGQAHETVVSEIERYFVMPGQACSYKIGELKMLELRERAKKTLDEKFNLTEFHNVTLGQGSMPLVLLEEAVDKYLENVN